MAAAAREALAKIEAVIPEAERGRLNGVEIHAPGYHMRERDQLLIDQVEAAVEGGKILAIVYRDAKEETTTRSIRPLGLWYWGKVWTALAWCQLREDFRLFRIDRILELHETGETFSSEKGKSLADFYATMECEEFPQSPPVR